MARLAGKLPVAKLRFTFKSELGGDDQYADGYQRTKYHRVATDGSAEIFPASSGAMNGRHDVEI
jgi:hypothetical protein